MNQSIEYALQQLNTLILGKETVLRQVLATVLAGGHVLLEDVPGVGKTTLSQGVARVLGLDYRRVQFTNDMLPADLLGVNIFRPDEGRFAFHPGPVFHEFLLADEINRASPKLQSALLEAMEERQVSVDGQTHALPQPFVVMATQNPTEQLGTFPLPESQLDRFMVRLSMGYPAAEALIFAACRRKLSSTSSLICRIGVSMLLKSLQISCVFWRLVCSENHNRSTSLSNLRFCLEIKNKR